MTATARLSALTLLALILLGAPLRAAEWHVSPQGAASGDGSQDKPWDLQTALNQPPAVKAGDTIWLHGGVYVGHFDARLTGTREAPIVVRQAPGERATLDGNFNAQLVHKGNTLEIFGGYTWFWGFEITSTYPTRFFGGSYDDLQRPSGLDIGNNEDVPGIKLINLVIHDTTQGPGVWKGAADNEMYGCLIYNNGYDAQDRGHGHGTYQQNRTGERLIGDNIIFNQYSYGIHSYGSERAFFENFRIVGNITFGNGAPSTVSDLACGILIGGGRPAGNPIVADNVCYYPPAVKGGTACNLNYGEGSANAVVTGNYFVSGARAFGFKGTATAIKGNTFLGDVDGIDRAQYPDNKFLGHGKPVGVFVVVRPNKYEKGRAHICVLNWEGKAAVRIEAEQFAQVLNAGDWYEVRDAQNYFGDPVAAGRFNGKDPVWVPTNANVIAQPYGQPHRTLEHTPNEFNAYVLIRK